MKVFFTVLLAFSSVLASFAQGNRSIIITSDDNQKPLLTLLQEIEQKHNIDFITDNEELIAAYTVTGIKENIYLNEFLEIFLEPMGLVPFWPQDDVIIFINKDVQKRFGNRKDNFIILKSDTDSETVKINGSVKEASDAPIPGAQIYLPNLRKGVVSDMDGNFSFQLEKGIHRIRGTFMGYDSTTYILAFSPRGSRNSIEIVLLPQSIHLQGVTITAKGADNNIQSKMTGVSAMTIETIKELPAFMGETDVIRSLTTFPGISTAGELSSGFNVRGGDVGQNLILQDDALIFNPTHLFGFFSAFNPDIVNGVDLYKGGGPANFGGRVSSVLNVNLRNGDAGKFTVNGGVGLISSRLTVEGPIQKSKSSFIIGGRISYVNWLIDALDKVELENSEANFHDLTGKLFFTLNDNNFISVTGYLSNDNFRLSSDSTFSWSTKNLSLSWDHSFSKKISSKLSLTTSNYSSSVDNSDTVSGFSYINGISNQRLNYDVQYSAEDKFDLLVGFDINQTSIEPGRLDPTSLGVNTEHLDINDQYSAEAAIYIQGDIDITSKLAVSAGLRFSNFWRYGEDEIYQYDFNELNGRYPSIIDTLFYDNGEIISYYSGLEPRLSLRYLLTDNLSVKASYYRSYQYLHLISNTVSTTPQDYWVSSSPMIKPEKADQWSIGIFKNFSDNKVELSVEGFYKDLFNAIDYIEGANNTLNESMEAGLIQGNGLAYGIETMIKKNYGKFYGWISYTYSRSLRRFDSPLEIKSINDGKLYPSVYDQPHNLSLIFNYRLGTNVIFSTNFSYSTGRPITIPISKVSYEHYLSVLNYSLRNEYRIPDYHRLDISLTIKDRQKNNKKIYGEWILGIYNLYGRKNPYSVFFNTNGTAYKMSILGSVLPSISYNFKL